MERPYVICHMLSSIDGKVTGEFLYDESVSKSTELYYELNRNYKADAFACGRVTMISSFADNQVDLSKYDNKDVSYEDYIANNNFNYYAVSFDRTGKVMWLSDHIEDEDEGYNNAHIIEVLSNKVSRAYLSYLQSIGVSYIFAGQEDISIEAALNKLYKYFGIKKLLLEGGSIINEAFINEDLVDEISLIVAPITAGNNSKSLFNEGNIKKFALLESKQEENSVILRYKRKER